MRVCAVGLCALLFGLIFLQPVSAALKADKVPEPLRPWVEWVLHGEEQLHCPFLFSSHDDRRCAWPTELQLDLDGQHGRFIQTWQVYAESWIRLPGDSHQWPQNVTVNGQPVSFVQREGGPMVRLSPGQIRLEGEFMWDRLPETLNIPADTGLIALEINGQRITFPDREPDGRLWLRERDTGKDKGEGDRVELRVFRRVVDEIPLQVITQIALSVSGAQRELELDGALLEGFVPLSLQTALPARIEAGGKLRLQVRPGRWTLTLVARHPEPITALPAFRGQAPWPTTEVWVFDARNQLRLVEVEGVPTIDPRQANLPKGWHKLPAYRVQAEQTMQLNVVRRGDPDPEPDKLQLQRTWWLDFDGEGYTLQDHISGSMTRGWRMMTQPPIKLGRVALDGVPQFITRLPGSDDEGVEVRRGSLNLDADSRIDSNARRLPVVGWDQDVHKVGANLRLPPGWRLVAAPGVDHAPGTWVGRWTLLDLFVVLIASLAVWRMWNWRWGLLTLVTLSLLWHEPLAPRYIWLNLLAAIALYRALPEGTAKRVAYWYRNLSLVSLAVIAVPFMVDQVRTGIYPQLVRPGGMGISVESPRVSAKRAPAEAKRGALGEPAAVISQQLKDTVEIMLPAKRDRRAVSLTEFDPNATIQTGPGLPQWQWRTVPLNWSGPVPKDQTFRLVLISPTGNFVLNLLRVLLLTGLGLLLFGLSYVRGRGIRLSANGALLAAAVSLLLSGAPNVTRAEFPEADMLKELKQRLMEPPECLAECAQSPRMRLQVMPDSLTARIAFHTLEEVFVPLPGTSKHWSPSAVMVDGGPAQDLARAESGELWLKLAAGLHDVVLTGPLPPRNTIELALPLIPHRVEVDASGWGVEGVHENGIADPQLKLTRIRDDGGTALPELEMGTLPAFASLERTLRLGLDWRVENRLRRVSPPGSAVVLEVPLLSGESVTTESVRVTGNKVLISIAADQSEFSWSSQLDKSERITLTAPGVTGWVETWRLDVGPVWHATSEGIPVIHHQNRQGRWLPTWRPWPGEQVTLTVSRPEGVPGRTLTIDRSVLVVKPGRRATDATVDLVIRSSEGAQHTVSLPQRARLQSVTIGGKAQPIRQDGNRVTLPIVPGQQRIQLSWRTADSIRSRYIVPPLDLGVDSVNSNVRLELSRDRWTLLTGGPRLGPAVLFWGVLIVILLIAVGLGRVPLTPLKSRHWFLLGVGLSQSTVWTGLVVVTWLLGLGARARLQQDTKPVHFQAVQTGLGLLTLVALVMLFGAVQQGLLGLPDMQVSGNGSNAWQFNWYQDRVASSIPQPWVVSVPLTVYRFAMLAWALWLAFALLHWLRWGWQCYSTGGLWREREKPTKKRGWRKKKDDPPPTDTEE